MHDSTAPNQIPTTIPLENGEILHFTWPDVYRSGQIMILNTEAKILSYLVGADQGPRLIRQLSFSPGEVSLLRPILENYPQHCPMEHLFAWLYNGRLTNETIARGHQRLQEAIDHNQLDTEMRPIRNLISRLRYKARSLHIDFLSVLETGYLLQIQAVPILAADGQVSFQSVPHQGAYFTERTRH